MAFDNAREQEQDTIVTVTFNERLLRSIVLDRRFRIIPMDDYLRFNLPTSRRLFRYLDLRRYRGSQAQSSLRMSVAELQRYLPLFTEAPSHVARNLTAVHQELADGGFLSTVPTIVRGRGASNWIVSYEFADSRQDAALEVVVDLEELVTLQLSVLRDLQNAAWYTKIAKVLPPDRVRALVTDIRMHINNGGFEMPVYRRTYSTWAKRAAVELGLKLTEDVG
jgi:hypothetical protein